MRRLFLISLLFLIGTNLKAQNKPEFDGQLSLIGSWAPENDLDVFFGGRYLPELSYKWEIDSAKVLDFEASANISGSLLMHPFDSTEWNGNLSPYRLWARYSTNQLELRVGLQKIDFGSATLLRPIQWFNQIDPRDPLQLTNGVYGALGRYYFLNNANVWGWVLYGNERTRGFDLVQTEKRIPEFGGRVQLPTRNGEFGLSYHHRTANSTGLVGFPQLERIPEDRMAIDGKWDLGVGLWFETAYIHKSRNLGILSHQALMTLGTDYTFGVGNGLNVVVEHMLLSYDTGPFQFANTANLTATSLTYPLGFFDNLSAVAVVNWEAEAYTFFLNHQHTFKHFTSYLMGFYNPTAQAGIQQNDLVNQFAGPGVRVMLVFNH